MNILETKVYLVEGIILPTAHFCVLLSSIILL